MSMKGYIKMKGIDFMASKKSKVELTRVNINLPKNLVEKVKEYGESIGINTTSAYIVLLNQGLDQKIALNNFPLMFQMFQEAKNMGIDFNDNLEED